MAMDLSTLGGLGLLYGAYKTQKDALSDYAKGVGASTEAAMSRYMPNLEFKPFTVTTTTGATSGYGADGLKMTASQQEQALQNQLFQQAQQQYGIAGQDIGGRTQDIYGMMRAAQTPQEQRDRLAMEERLAAQGRLGVQTAQYGGTPEQLALAKAQQEAQNQAYLGARQAALGEQLQAANLGGSMFTQAYLPQAQMLNAYQQGLSGAQLEQQARQQYGLSGLETSLSAEDARLQAMLGQANLTGGALTGLANVVMPQINPQTGLPIANTGLFGSYTLSDLYNDIKSWI